MRSAAARLPGLALTFGRGPTVLQLAVSVSCTNSRCLCFGECCYCVLVCVAVPVDGFEFDSALPLGRHMADAHTRRGPTFSIQLGLPVARARHTGMQACEAIIMMPTTPVRSIGAVHLQASRPVLLPMMAWTEPQTFGAHFSKATMRLARTARASSR
jgi:hypothetical protein